MRLTPPGVREEFARFRCEQNAKVDAPAEREVNDLKGFTYVNLKNGSSQGHNPALTVSFVPNLLDMRTSASKWTKRSYQPSERDQIAFFSSLICTGACRNPAICGTDECDWT